MKERIVALMTAKGNNTLNRKNLLPVSGHPLMWWPSTAARRAPEVTDFYCSSDSDEILSLASSVGYRPIRRPDALALPQSQHVDAIRHALEAMRVEGVEPTVLVVLLGNTVFLKTSWISFAVNELVKDSSLDSVAACYREQDRHPYRARRLDEAGCLVPWFDFGGRAVSTNRQDLPANYYFSHNFWAIRLRGGRLPSEGLQPWTFMGRRVRPLVVDEGFDVHTAADLAACEAWLRENDVFDVPASASAASPGGGGYRRRNGRRPTEGGRRCEVRLSVAASREARR